MPRASGIDASYRTYEPLPRISPFRFENALLTAILLLSTLSWTLAQGGLYGPEAPRDISYVRVINASSPEPVTPAIDGENWQPLPFANVSPYRQLAPGEHTVSIAGHELALNAHPESFTTLVLLQDTVLTIEDTPLRDISRGLLSLYNLTSDGALTLSTAEGTEVIAGVEPHSAGSRAISQAEVGLVVHRGDEVVGSLEPQLYRRGEAHAVIVLPRGSDPQVIYAQAGAER
jgi:hypothetical protein